MFIIKIILILTSLILLSGIDSIIYGHFHQNKKINFLGLFWSVTYKGITYYPLYRCLQGVLDILVIYFIYITYGLIPLIGFLLAWYFMVKEFLYYIFMNEIDGLKEFEKNKTNTYWLNRIWFSGFWLFRNGFTVKKFIISFLIGLIIILISIIL